MGIERMTSAQKIRQAKDKADIITASVAVAEILMPWCEENQREIIARAKDLLPNDDPKNTQTKEELVDRFMQRKF